MVFIFRVYYEELLILLLIHYYSLLLEWTAKDTIRNLRVPKVIWKLNIHQNLLYVLSFSLYRRFKEQMLTTGLYNIIKHCQNFTIYKLEYCFFIFFSKKMYILKMWNIHNMITKYKSYFKRIIRRIHCNFRWQFINILVLRVKVSDALTSKS